MTYVVTDAIREKMRRSALARAHLTLTSEEVVALYESGLSITDIAKLAGGSRSAIHRRLQAAGCRRTRAEGSGLDRSREKVRQARLRQPAKGTTMHDGYVVYTNGPHKDRSVHVVRMEEKIGRRIQRHECVHHIDGDRSNNDLANLRLMTRVEHTRLHRSS